MNDKPFAHNRYEVRYEVMIWYKVMIWYDMKYEAVAAVLTITSHTFSMIKKYLPGAWIEL